MSSIKEQNATHSRGVSQALLRTLKVAGVKFIRYHFVDASNKGKVKSVPISYLERHGKSLSDYEIQIPSVVVAGLLPENDFPAPNSGLGARGHCMFQPDLSTVTVLPYAPDSAIVLGNLMDSKTGDASDLCARSALQIFVQKAAREHNIGFSVGAEIEFVLRNAKTNEPVDLSTYATSGILNDQRDFISALHDQLDQQEIPFEKVHAESAHGQLEVVLEYSKDPVLTADRVLLTRETITALAHQFGLKALFLPKFNNMQAGNGCHLHLSMYNTETGKNLFPARPKADTFSQPESTEFQLEEANVAEDISATGQSFVEGILQHLPGLMALTLSTVNSMRRVGPGCWTGSSVNWSYDDKESPLRVVSSESFPCDHVELKLNDHQANLYLALTAVLSSGLKGISENLRLRPNRYYQDDKLNSPLPESLEESLNALEKDDFLRHALPSSFLQGFMAIGRAEVENGSSMSLEEEVAAALSNA